jgi:hypothetical protein
MRRDARINPPIAIANDIGMRMAQSTIMSVSPSSPSSPALGHLVEGITPVRARAPTMKSTQGPQNFLTLT